MGLRKEQKEKQKEEGKGKTCNIVTVEIVVFVSDNGALAELSHTRSHSSGNVLEDRLVPTNRISFGTGKKEKWMFSKEGKGVGAEFTWEAKTKSSLLRR